MVWSLPRDTPRFNRTAIVYYIHQRYFLSSGSRFESGCSHLTFSFRACFDYGVPWHSGNYWKAYVMWFQSGFILKGVRDVAITYSQIHRADKYSEHSSVIWPDWPNGWVFAYELSGSGFESSCSHLTFRFSACFKQGVPWHSGNYTVWIHSETRKWHDNNIQSVIKLVINMY